MFCFLVLPVCRDVSVSYEAAPRDALNGVSGLALTLAPAPGLGEK